MRYRTRERVTSNPIDDLSKSLVMAAKSDSNPYGISSPVRRREDARFVTGHGRYTNDIDVPGQAHAAFVRSDHPHGTLKHIDTEDRGEHAGRDRDLQRRRPAASRRGIHPSDPAERLRPRDKSRHPAAGSRPGPCAPRGRAGRACCRGDRGTSGRRSLDDQGRNRSAAMRHQPGERHCSGRTGDLGRCARQCRDPVEEREPGRDRRCFRRGSARDPAEARQLAGFCQRHRASCRHRAIRQSERSLHLDHAEPGRPLHAARHVRPGVQDPRRENARPDLRCRRSIRIEGAALSRRCRAVACGAGHRPAGQMACGAHGKPAVRQPRPRRRDRMRAGARRKGQVPGDSRVHPAVDGRILRMQRAQWHDPQHALGHAARIPDASGACGRGVRDDQHRADRAIPGRRPRAGIIHCGATGR